MGGLNSLGGLNNVNVDFRPTVELTAPEKEVTAPQQPVSNAAPENAPPPKAKSPEVKMALNWILGGQSIAIPEEIDREFYDKLMEMDAHPDTKKAFLDTIKPRISDAALKATYKRDYLHKMFN